MVRNNQPATITVGQTVPFVTGQTYTANVGMQNNISWRDVGIILQVTPFITSDGLVEMIVAPEISALTDEYVTVSSNVNLRVVSNRKANTVVVTPDRQPIVIGGLMSNEKVMNESKIPWLGDIPWVGAAFRRRVTSTAKKELLIFLLPTVVRAPSELAAYSDKESKDISLDKSSFSYDEVQKFFDGIPVNKPEPSKKKK
jgi:general secretion pathway protein D